MTEALDSITTTAGNFLEGGDPERALELYLKAASIARAAGMQKDLSSLLGDMAVAYRRMGNVPAAIATNRQAIEAARACGHDLNIARWSGNLGGLLYANKDIEGAEACFREGLEAAARTGSPEQMSIAAGHLAGMMGERGRFTEAVETMAQAREYAKSSPTVTSIVRSQELGLFLRWADSLREEGRLREAREVISRALAIAAGPLRTKAEVLLLILLGDIEETEDIIAACEALERAAGASEALGDHNEAKELRDIVRRMKG